MNRIMLIILIGFISTKVYSQSISNDGKYVCVNIEGVLVIQSTATSWKKEIKDASPLGNMPFSRNNKYIFYTIADTLFKLSLGTDDQMLITNVINNKQPKSGSGEWLAYNVKGKAKVVALLSKNTWKQQYFQNVTDYSFDENGNVLLLKTTDGTDSISVTKLKWVSLQDGNVSTIWSNTSSFVLNYSFDTDGTQLCFMVQDKQDSKFRNAIWFYKVGMNNAELLANNESAGIKNGLEISDYKKILGFSKLGSRIFFSLEKKEGAPTDLKLAKLDVYSYMDPIIQTQQLRILSQYKQQAERYVATISLRDHHITQLQGTNERLLGLLRAGFFEDPIQLTDDYALICDFEGDICRDYFDGDEAYIMNEYNWNKATRSSVYLVSTEDGSRKLLKGRIKAASNSFPHFLFSPSGKYVVYYDQEQKNYFSYDIATGITKNLTKAISAKWANEDSEAGYYFATPSKSIHWLANDVAMFINEHGVYGRNSDIWKIDPSGEKKPINISKGYARKNHLLLKNFSDKEVYNENEIMLFTGTNIDTRDQGLYSLELNKVGNPKQLLALGPYSQLIGHKAINGTDYLFSREDSKGPRSYFFTIDFKTVTPITSQFSKMKTGVNKEVIRWKTFNGENNIGIMYKPENFNPKKKYPVIFEYYENLASNEINVFDENEMTDTSANVPGIFAATLNRDYCLRNGYLVFIPDIHYILGETGKSVYNSVVSGAEYLSKMPYVDAKKMGIIGHSFGGYETNYLVTHTSIFAAACSGSGLSDFISKYGYVENDIQGYGQASDCEKGQTRIGTTPWLRPDLYLKNSPVFYAEKVTTPLLMMANKNDTRVPFGQGMELFKALRRLGKRCWLLQYDEGDHTLNEYGDEEGKKDEQDWGIREMQFFDHYLKEVPAPVWMTRGIPARLKGRTLGYEYDTTMKTPGPGLLMENEGALTPRQKELLKHRTMVNNEGRIVNASKKTITLRYKIK